VQSKIAGMTATIVPTWLRVWQQWLMAVWFWFFFLQLQTRKQLTLATKRQIWHGQRNLQPTEKCLANWQ